MTNDRNMGNIETANQSNLVSAHGIFNITEVAGNSNDKSDVEKIAKDLKKCIEIRQNRGTKITIDDNGTLLLGRNIKFNRK